MQPHTRQTQRRGTSSLSGQGVWVPASLVVQDGYVYRPRSVSPPSGKAIDMSRNYVEVHADDGGFDMSREPTHRVDAQAYSEWCALRAKLGALQEMMLEAAVTPVYVTPEQEESIRAIAKDDAWIVVREAEPVRVVSLPVVQEVPAASPPQPGELPVAAPPTPAAPEPVYQAILRQRCEARGGLPHTVLRYVITDEMSLWSGHKRVDGLCQCGTRIPDVPCPHQKQTPDSRKRPMCAWCNKLIINSGFVDNRLPDGGLDPRIALPVPIGATGKGDAATAAYRQGE